ncbi:MAG: 6-carboxytetrahydropterin synthase QueD [Deltaproteobacteria bacterium]|nr:6-carboxytetrahydropterin synthase QueD [Deltaproteobacteria bacterium]
MYTVVVHSTFSSAHKLRGYHGDCEELHGHNWKVVVEVAGASLDNLGMVMDFRVLKKRIHAVTQKLDHAYLNDIPPFDTLNPSSENISSYIFRELKKTINDDRIRLSKVTVWESDNAAAVYSE